MIFAIGRSLPLAEQFTMRSVINSRFQRNFDTYYIGDSGARLGTGGRHGTSRRFTAGSRCDRVCRLVDLALDDAPVLVVTGMNDENVPTSEIGHQFLPNELCKKLEILDNDRRFARDCYSLLVITSVREHYHLIAGRRDDQG